jgi:hypothetical protein
MKPTKTEETDKNQKQTSSRLGNQQNPHQKNHEEKESRRKNTKGQDQEQTVGT